MSRKKEFKKPTAPKEKTADPDNLCDKCGYSAEHFRCPARNAKCNHCGNIGHFKSVCRIRQREQREQQQSRRQAAHALASDDSDDCLHLVNTIHTVDVNDKSLWWETVVINDKAVSAQLDTGASRSVLPLTVLQKIKQDAHLDAPSCSLKSYTKHQLPVVGSITLPVEYKGRKTDVNFCVVNLDQKTLLSGGVCKQLGLIERINNLDEYPELKKTTGTLPFTYSIKIDPTVPPVVHGPRRQPKALKDKIVAKLNEMVQDGQLTPVTEPTDWVSSLVTVVKGDKVRLCIDPKDLNRAIKREHYPIPTIEEVIADLPTNAKVFSVIDAKSGYLQIKLDKESSLLTTFNTPIGRFRWLRLPFGIKSAPEVFQRIMDTMLEGIPEAKAIMDDILVAGVDAADHDRVMKKVVERATEYNLKLNWDKCQIKQSSVKYVGHVISEDGVQVQDEKVRAVRDMPTPENKEAVSRFLGIVQYLAKFIPNLSAVDAPLRELLKKDIEFHWDKPQETSFQCLKDLCCKAPVLRFYDPSLPATIQCDASSFALGGVLLQNGQPIAYTSRALTEVETRYAQIEKETLAIVHSCKKFHNYIFGRPVEVQSDHKPLQAIFRKQLLAAPMRLQAMLLRLQPYDLTVTYVPGKQIPIGDALSRANLPEAAPELKMDLINAIDHIAVSLMRYLEMQEKTASELSDLSSIILAGWPDKKEESPVHVREYWNFRDELTVADGIIFKGMRIVVPPSMQSDMLQFIHASHMGIVKCKMRARESLFWPGMMNQVEILVANCPSCNMFQNSQPKEALLPTPTPDLPWISIAADIFDWEREQYLLVVDYFSKYIEVNKLPDMSTAAVIRALKDIVCRHGIPETLRTDNGPQFGSHKFHTFCNDMQITHITSSPHYPQANGEAERAVQTVKQLWAKGDDKSLALLDYRTTPMASCALSPAQLCMSRRPRNLIPTARQLLSPITLNIHEIRRRLDVEKNRQKFQHDRSKFTQELPQLRAGDPVYMAPLPGSKKWLPGKVVEPHENPRSYVVQIKNRRYRRNRTHLRSRRHLSPSSENRAMPLSEHHSPLRHPHGISRMLPSPRDHQPSPLATRGPGPNTDYRSPQPLADVNIPAADVNIPATSNRPTADATIPGSPNTPARTSQTLITKSGRVVKPKRLTDFDYD